MSRDYAEKEREFIESLKADTGRDLAQWMNVIGAQEFAHRNDIIDWLRQQGFLFAWASWLERIYHNGGKPIYYDEAAAKPDSSEAVREVPKPIQEAPRPTVAKVISETTSPPPASSAPVSGAPVSSAPVSSPRGGSNLAPEIKALIASARAYAPLAGYLVRRIKEAIPTTRFEAGPKHIAMHTGPEPFALLAIGSKDLRIAFAGPPGVHAAPHEKVRLPNLGSPLPAGLTHMIQLTDARQIDEAFVDSLAGAQARAHR
jgi:hypothetical protein